MTLSKKVKGFLLHVSIYNYEIIANSQGGETASIENYSHYMCITKMYAFPPGYTLNCNILLLKYLCDVDEVFL